MTHTLIHISWIGVSFIKKYIIETKKLTENIHAIKNYVKVPVIGVVKGNGYGLGLLPYAKILQENGIEMLAVSESSEAIALYENGFSNILLLTPQNDEEILKELISRNIRLTVGNLQNLAAILKVNDGNPPLVHIKIDTGFGRFGFNYKNIADIYNVFESIQVEAIFSHFSSAFEKHYKITKEQNDRFSNIADLFRNRGIYTHIANSCAALRFPETRHDAVRIGSAFLGRLPVIPPLKLHKIGYLLTTVIDSSIVYKGDNIGYGNVCKAKRTIKTATVEIGYKDGFELKREPEAYRWIDILKYIYGDLKSFHKQIYLYENENPILGRVSMYSTTIVNENHLKPSDTVRVSANPLYIDSAIQREFI